MRVSVIGKESNTDNNITNIENRANNEDDVADFKTDVEEELFDNQQPYYIERLSDLKDCVGINEGSIPSY